VVLLKLPQVLRVLPQVRLSVVLSVVRLVLHLVLRLPLVLQSL
jgi:hypothetical protein